MNNIKERITSILQENTGRHLLDSGGAYGRHWQDNQQIDDFDDTPVYEVELYPDSDEVLITYNIYHYLTNFLQVTEQSERLNKQLEAFMKDSDESYLYDMETFTEQFVPYNRTVNTYNGETILSQVLQYTTFNLDGEDDFLFDDFIVLQVHNGCDVRGGYTVPQVFKVRDIEYFSMAQYEVRTYCEYCQRGGYSDDAGYHFYEVVPRITTSRDGKPVAIHEYCGHEVKFNVLQEW